MTEEDNFNNDGKYEFYCKDNATAPMVPMALNAKWDEFTKTTRVDETGDTVTERILDFPVSKTGHVFRLVWQQTPVDDGATESIQPVPS